MTIECIPTIEDAKSLIQKNNLEDLLKIILRK